MVNSASANNTFNDESVLGKWSGILDVGTFRLTLTFDISQDLDHNLHAKMNCLEQGITDLPIQLTSDGDLITFEISQPAAVFKGHFNERKTTLNGHFLQNGMSIPLILSKEKNVESKGSIRPQYPQLPYPYIEENVNLFNSSAQVTLASTLTLPKAAKDCPAVILIAGSGPNDRNETLFGHKPFLVLADYLTRAGIAVLRFDKRGVGESTGNFEISTTEDFRDDVCAGVDYLKTRKEINSKQIGLIGHSEGGIIAPMVAVKSKDIAWIVLMAASGVKGDELLYEQGKLISEAMGLDEEQIEQQQALQKLIFSVIEKETDSEKTEVLLREAITKHINQLPKEKRYLDSQVLESQIKRANTNWFRYFISYDPAVTLKQIHVPLLALNGERDLQVPSKKNLSAITKSLEKTNEHFTAIEFPKLNHLFQTCKSGSVTEYAEIEETISPLVLSTISDWILKTCEKIRKHEI